MNILVTGITGFIGGHLCKKLLEDKNNKIIALIRPNTDIRRYQEFKDKGVICKLGKLTSPEFIVEVFNPDKTGRDKFDIVYHIAALRGGRNFPKKDYYETNVNATKYIAEQCLKHKCKLVFCSSVGVFGTFPDELPPNENTSRKSDNYYHFTKILAEKELQKLVKQGLKLIIIRPTITYGIGDYGFPYKLISLLNKGLMILPNRDIKINMVDVNTLISAFISAGKGNLPSGSAYNIADKNPVSLRKLVDFISYQLKNRKYPSWKKVPMLSFKLLDFILSKNERLRTSIKLISRSWYYDVSPAEMDLHISTHETIPNFKYVIDWYKSVK